MDGINSARWQDWVIVETEGHELLELLAAPPSSAKNDWEELSTLSAEYRPIIDQITEIYRVGFTSMMVVADFL
jgi:hypothetical protein